MSVFHPAAFPFLQYHLHDLLFLGEINTNLTVVIRNLLNGLLYSNVFIALCAMAFTARGFLLLDTPPQLIPVLFAGSATLFTYLLIRIAAVSRIREYPTGGRWDFFLRHLVFLRILMIVSAIGCAALFLFLPDAGKMSVLLPGLISVLYGLPLRFGKQRQRLRDIGLLKIFLIAFVWAYIGSVLPLASAGGDMGSPKVWLLFGADYLFVLAITIPFDIKDMTIDAMHAVRTLPVVLGREWTLSLAMVLLFMSGVAHTLCFRHFFPNNIDHTIPLVISLIISGMTIWMSQRSGKDWVYFGLLDGMLILQYVLVLTFGLTH